jgi:two-component system, NarL family, response regulator NreC
MTDRAKETPTTVLLGDGHSLLRAGLRAMFARYPYLKVVGEAAEGSEIIRLARELDPDLVLLDINLPELDGIAVTEALGRALPSTRVLILTAATGIELLQSALRAGACGYVLKRASETELISAIEAVLRGDLYLDPSVTRALLTKAMILEPSNIPIDTCPSLTTRELEVLLLVSEGYTTVHIAENLGLSVRTIESYRAKLMLKLGTRSRADMVRLAKKYHLMQTPRLKSISQFTSDPQIS